MPWLPASAKGTAGMEFRHFIEAAGEAVDFAGVLAIVLGSAAATAIAAVALFRGRRPVYEPYRRQLGRSILLGLELLVAADIIRTVAITPTFESLGVLAAIILIRTFLSYSLQLEVTGRLPWQPERPSAAPGP